MENFKKFERIKNIKLLLNSLSLEPRIERNNLTITPISASGVLKRSYGEIKKAETVHYRTYRPIKDGLLCEVIFGPDRDYECACGAYKGTEHKDKTCDRCGVEITTSRVRDERMGHIRLGDPVIHPFFLEHLAGIFEMSGKELYETIYGEKADKSMKDLQEKIGSKTKEANMFLDAILVLPPNKRPFVYLEEMKEFVCSDVNDLYRRLINRNNRLRRLKDLNAPNVIIKNESRMLQDAIDTLFFNETSSNPVLGMDNRALKSLTGMLTDQVTNFWSNTCNYSGRAIVISDPELSEKQCRLPGKALIELYKPLIIHELKKLGVADTIRSARYTIEKNTNKEAVKIALNKAILSRPLVVTYDSRATAFNPKIGENDVLSLNPEVCKKLGLEMSAEKVSFHLPLSEAAVREAKSLVGKCIEGNGKVESTFSSLVEDNSIGPLIDVVVQEKSLPLSMLERNLILKD